MSAATTTGSGNARSGRPSRPAERRGAPQLPRATEAAPPRPARATRANAGIRLRSGKSAEALPATIERLEAEIHALHADMAQPAFYQQPGDRIAQENARLKGLEEQLAAAYQRWEELEQLAE